MGGTTDYRAEQAFVQRRYVHLPLPNAAPRILVTLKSNGIHLSGVPTRDTVSIWAIGGGKGEHDLLISNPTNGWLEFTVDREGEKITVTARLWDSSPPGW